MLDDKRKHARNLLLITVVVSVIVNTNQGIVAGPGCWAACATPCCLMGPFKFAALVGVALDFGGCTVMCMVACAPGLGIPGLCFDKETTAIRLSDNGEREVVKVTDLIKGDHVLTTNWLTKEEQSNAVTNVRMFIEDSNFVKISVSNEEVEPKEITHFIEVTQEHEMIVRDREGKIVIKPASQVAIGDQFLRMTGISTVVEVSVSKKAQRVQITTERGTILANGMLTSTRCSGKESIVTPSIQ